MYGSPTKICILQGRQVIEAYLPPWAKKEEVEIYNFEGEEDNS